jgi:phage tail-like protein
MPPFTVNPSRVDPYRNFKFRVTWDGRQVAGVSKVSGLRRSTVPVAHREGGDHSASHLAPGPWKYDPITLERGVTHDNAFEAWANLAHNLAGDAAMSLKNLRKDIRIELLDEQGNVAIAFNVFRCWVSEYTAIADLDANANAVAIEQLVLQNEGWERDPAVNEPAET